MGQSYSVEPVVEKETETDRNETYDAAVSSCQGWRFSQEDDHSLKLELPGPHKAAFFAVFDGHGSDKVSKHAAESLWRHITENELYIQGNFKEALEQSFLSFDREVFESYNARLAGTTATSVLIIDNVIYCANIGDSRSVASVNCGYVHGNRVNGNLALSRAFGDFHYKSNEQLPADQQIVSPLPEIERIELNDDVDFIVLACDGIWDVLTSDEVVEFVISRLEQEVRPNHICEQLITRCLSTDYELVIGCDNMTVLLVCYTRGTSWSDYCTEIFNKNTTRLGLTSRTRELDNNFGNETTTFMHPSQRLDKTKAPPNSGRIKARVPELAPDQSIAYHDPSSLEPTTDDAELSRRKVIDDWYKLTFERHRLSEPLGEDSDDKGPSISEAPAEEVVTSHDSNDGAETSTKQSEVDTSMASSSSDTQQQQQQQQANIATENLEADKSSDANGKDKEDDEATKRQADESLISSSVVEINLDDGNLNEDDLPDASEIEPIELASPRADNERGSAETDQQHQELSEGTVEIELSAPDEDDSDDAETNQTSNEDDEGITVEEPAEDSNSAPQEDTNNDASDDTSGES